MIEWILTGTFAGFFISIMFFLMFYDNIASRRNEEYVQTLCKICAMGMVVSGVIGIMYMFHLEMLSV